MRSEFLRGERCHFGFKVCIFLLSGQVGPFVRIFAQVIKFFAVLPVMYVSPVTVNDRVFSGVHVGKEDGTVLGLVRLSKNRGNGRTFLFLPGLGQATHLLKSGIHINQAYRHIGYFIFGHTGTGPNKRNVGGPFPQGVLSPVSFFT